jgi:uncharacterized protein with FMN-binding domain
MKHKLNYFIDTCLLFAFILCGITGFIKMPELNFEFKINTYNTISFIHDWSGVFCIILSAVHILLHARWFINVTKKILFKSNANNKKIKLLAADITSKAVKTTIILFFIIFLIQPQSNVWARGSNISSASIPQGIDYKASNMKDGTYTGTANGYMPSLTVSVVIKNGIINSIDIVNHNETARWFNSVINVIPGRIISSQSTKIDAVSGATCSSYGIMSAVEDALKKAGR